METPKISLKFGRIKGGDFNGSPEALQLFNANAPDADVINAYNGEIYLWWDDKYCSKQEAIDYIEDYKLKSLT